MVMLDFIKYVLPELLFILLVPIVLPFAALWSFIRGDLFPVNIAFGNTCGVAGGFEQVGNGMEWLTIFVFIVTMIVRFVYKWPKNWILTLLIFYIVMALVYILSNLIGEPSSEFCM